METRGLFAPADEDAVRRWWAATGPTAQTAVRETTMAMGFDRAEYDERVDAVVVGTAHEAIFASLLEVHVGNRVAFEAAVDEHPDLEVIERGNPDVERVAWHVSPATGTIVAATFAREREAAVGTLRRQALGGCYRPLLEELGLLEPDPGADEAEDGDDGAEQPGGSEDGTRQPDGDEP